MPNYRAMARRAARRHGLDPGIFERQIQQESGFQTGRSSGAGAQGIAQIMPATARSWGVDPNNPKQALDAAAKHMAGYVRKFGGYENALRAYNAGPGAVQRSKGFSETNHYVATILGGKNPKRLGPSRGTPGTPGRAGAISLGDPGTAVDVAAALSAPANEEPAPTASMPTLPAILTPKGYTPVSAGAAPTPRPKLTDALAKLSSLTDSDSTISGTAGRPGRAGTPGGGGGRAPKSGSQIKELIYNDGGKGFGIKNGQTVDGPSFYSGVWAGHANHVHAAAGPKTIVRLGKLAQSMGLHVGENPHFGGVTPVHVQGSNHYKGEAIDVSGDPAKMRQFAKAVARYQRRRG
jgi:hypothetical protein